PDGAQTTYYFEYGKTTNYGSYAPNKAGASAGSDYKNHAESQAIAGLAPNTLYHFRIVAKNFATASMSRGADKTFTTLPLAPVVVTGGATGLTAGGATLTGTVDPRGVPTTYHFEYGKTTAYGSTVP